MPGFSIAGDGIDGRNKNNRAEFRRKHRWRFTVAGTSMNQTDFIYLQKAARPSFKLEAPEVHHDQEVAYFAGKQTWEEITLEFYDATTPVDITTKLWDWVNTIVSLNGGEMGVEPPSGYKKDVTLEMTDGKGESIDTWVLYGAWPMSTNWNDIDYSSTDIQTISVTLKFDRAMKTI